MDYFTLQDKFTANLIDAYKIGKLCADFRPYIEWKAGGGIFSREQAYKMMDSASHKLDSMFDNPEADTELRSYLEAIDGEIANILPALS